MASKKPSSGGGWQAIRYTMGKAGEVGPLNLWRAMRAKNACKTCALGMGGQKGGMRNEAGHFPEFCKKSLQAMVADMRGKIEPKFFETYSLDQLRSFSPRELEAAGRITQPVIAAPGDTHYRPIEWEAAYDVIARSFRETEPRRAVFYSSGRSSNEAGFLLQLVARAYGTNHVNNCSYYCHQASGVGLYDSLGTGTSTVILEDLQQCDLVFVIGGNPASNHPRLLTELMKVRRRGGQVIVVNPMREIGLVKFRVPSNPTSLFFGSEIASHYAMPKIGGDIALMAGIAKCLLRDGKIDRDYIASHTENFDDLGRQIDAIGWPDIESASGVGRAEIETIAEAYGRSERTIFAWTMGITHHEHGVENVQWIVNLALLRGMIGKPGAGVMPIRGHSNVQGLGSVGVTPRIGKLALEGLASLGIPNPDFSGYDTMSAMEAAHRGEIDTLIALGGNLFGANPDANFASEALGRIGTVTYLSTTLNTSHAWGTGQTTLILPVLARDEESESTTQESMFNYVRLSDGGPRRYEGPKAETEILAALGTRIAPQVEFDLASLASHEQIRALIARLIPGYQALAEIGVTKEEFHIPGRTLHKVEFPRAGGRAAFRPHPIPSAPQVADDEFILMTVRSEGQFNTVVFEEEDVYRGQERRDIILLNPQDIDRLGLRENETVDVESQVGCMTGLLVRPFDIALGCAAMYYPEANVLVPRTVDSRSKTPAFKSVRVTVRRSQAAAPAVEQIEGPEHLAKSRARLKSC